jgi:hypothetical protein
MRVRILITNGRRTVDVFWVEHTGKDVYCGATKSSGKRSYHGSGKVHFTDGGVRTSEGWHVPLRDLKGQFHLTSINVGNARGFVQAVHTRLDYSGKKADAVLLIDARQIPTNVQTSIAIGLVEPGNGAVLGKLISHNHEDAELKISSRQALISTCTNPWVYAIVSWLENLPPNTSLERARGR